MSEEILRALTQLFAIVTKQDSGVTEKERSFVIEFLKQDLDEDSVKEYIALYDSFIQAEKGVMKDKSAPDSAVKTAKLTSVSDSVKTLSICKKINKTLTQKQKTFVLVKMLELCRIDSTFISQRMEVINIISTVFNIDAGEYREIEKFALEDSSEGMLFQDILTIGSKTPNDPIKHITIDLEGEIIFLRVKSVDMYFVKYVGSEEVVLNNFIMKPRQVYLFSHGSTIKTPQGNAFYYSDVTRHYIEDLQSANISFNAFDVEYRLPNGELGLRNINISEGAGHLVGIMGVSGAGKTTLLNVLSGIDSPSRGKVLLNGIDVHAEKEKIEGVIGYVSQDDMLIEELTVFQNLYFNAKLCFADLDDEAIEKKVMDVLERLGLQQHKDMRVGTALDKTISGGQRKRLNIALELIREPSVMFVDEPTSGLSSRDSENVVDLLKELSLKGKLIFVVIHQPSSDIYKMFDKMFILDVGGYPVFYGHPIEAATYFKKVTIQVDRERGQCPTCGNINPEQIFNIIEAEVVDEYGQLTGKRKINPRQWHEKYLENFNLQRIGSEQEKPPKSLNIPSRLKQVAVFIRRDILSKVSNRQYLLINLLEAPLLAFILAIIIHYKNSPDNSEYIFRFNDNFPIYIMMAVIVALFMGLTVSAEEIIRDRKVLKRETFLNLSWNSYLISKIIVLFALSAIQTFTFTIIGNTILEVEAMTLSFWIVLFSLSCFSNLLGLNISSAFNSAVTIYILIPIIIIPQMILSGVMFSFDKLNEAISEKDEPPILADLMASRWAYEAMAVDHFKNNPFERYFYPLEKIEKQADFTIAFLIPTLEKKLEFALNNKDSDNPAILEVVDKDLKILRYQLHQLGYSAEEEAPKISDIRRVNLNKVMAEKILSYFRTLKERLRQTFNQAVIKQEKMMNLLETSQKYNIDLGEFKNAYYNDRLAEMVRNLNVEDRIIEYEGKLIQLIDPIFNDPDHISGPLDYRAHYFAPTKHLFGNFFDTYHYNVSVMWLMTIFLYATLYFELLRKFLNYLEKIRISVIHKKN